MDLGSDAHMINFPYLLEFGLIATGIVLSLFAALLHRLWCVPPTERSLFWATIALLAGPLTQETSYPTVAFGDFVGLYFVSVMLALSSQRVEFDQLAQENPPFGILTGVGVYRFQMSREKKCKRALRIVPATLIAFQA